jgi:hypothetical protein
MSADTTSEASGCHICTRQRNFLLNASHLNQKKDHHASGAHRASSMGCSAEEPRSKMV